MSVVGDNQILNAWSAGEVLTNSEIFQNRGGADVAVATGASQPVDDADGVLLKPGESVLIASGLTAYWRKVAPQSANLNAIMSRTVVS